ncbi:uncharacterized protein ARMOST_15660 [Armillaria ostoyae]|uniref:Uncharacterized protein n=2 Tax=Armillaria TaxID=47424 RepID=A0A284RU11_ARMOS|nr:hypothetical protein ARMSODRAFT_947802 [Armillaria solidipes]SJL12237.1 uncharacterized protein ARMOST_15660 [Armillaria ostoyae]
MSFDSASSGSLASHPLTVDIPAQYPLESNSSSVNSSLSSSPTATGGMTIPSPSPKGILDIRNRSASLPSSTTSLPTTAMNVKFAPLPELAPRRRRSTAPLGVAARSQLMRRRRGMHGEDPPPVPSGNGMWTETELEDHARRIASEEQDRRDQEDFEDPFLALGKMMKGAWKKMSNSSGSNRAKTSKAVVVSGMTDSMPQQEPRTSNLIVREDSEAEQGGVWEEEIGHAIPRNIGQTETIREVERQQKDSRSSSS